MISWGFFPSPGELPLTPINPDIVIRQWYHWLHKSKGYKCISCQERGRLPVRVTVEVSRGQKSKKEVSSLFHINTHQLCLSSLSLHLLFFSFSLYSVSLRWSLYATYSPPLTFSLHLLFLLCWHAIPGQTPTRADLAISPIQPPESNYHGQNRVIKSNGLLYEVHTQK